MNYFYFFYMAISLHIMQYVLQAEPGSHNIIDALSDLYIDVLEKTLALQGAKTNISSIIDHLEKNHTKGLITIIQKQEKKDQIAQLYNKIIPKKQQKLLDDEVEYAEKSHAINKNQKNSTINTRRAHINRINRVLVKDNLQNDFYDLSIRKFY